MNADPKANCATCKHRSRLDGGKGDCPFGAVVRDIFAKRGEGNTCVRWNPREYVKQVERNRQRNHPQEAALF